MIWRWWPRPPRLEPSAVRAFIDGFRTSHEVNKLIFLTDEDIRALVPEDLVRAHRGRELTPERPFIAAPRRTPTCISRARETVNPFYFAAPGGLKEAMDALLTPRPDNTTLWTTSAIRPPNGSWC